MRGSGWLLAIAVLAAWLASVGYPAVAALREAMWLPHSHVEIRASTSLLITSVGWAMAIAIGATVMGWLPGRLLGRSLQHRGFIPLATLMLAPICLPAYVVFFAWWQSWPPDSALGRWIAEHQYVQIARQGTLFVALLCWSWPLVAWCVAGTAAQRSAQRDDLLRLDGAGAITRLIDHLRSDASGLCLGALLVFLATLANTTCFDLAEVFTFSNELRAVEALGANARDVLTAGLPGISIAMLAALAAWFMLSSRSRDEASRVGQLTWPVVIGAGLIWIISVALPIGLFVRNVMQAPAAGQIAREFLTLYHSSVLNTMGLALVSGCIGAVITAGFALVWQDRRGIVRLSGSIAAIGWLIAAVIPGTIVGMALQAAYNRGIFAEVIYQNRAILIIGHLASFGFVAALLGRWVARREPQVLRDLRALDGAHTLGGRGLIESSWPRLLAAGGAALAVIFVLAIGEIPVTAKINPPQPPGSGPLALVLLNDMHYQRPQTVMIATLGMIGLALLAATVVATSWMMLRHLTRAAKPILAVLLLGFCSMQLTACTPENPEEPVVFQPTLMFGAAGNSLGQFAYPRAISIDPQRQFVYVVDKLARVQRFGFDGRPQLQWRMPAMENGKPTGVSVAPDGRVFVADTHYFRVIAYDLDGRELLRFGEYGEGPGQFTYTTDVAFGPHGRLYVSEYGGNDRIQVFDDRGEYLFEFGSFGAGESEFNRPQAIAFNPQQTELFIADACNHRIVVTDPDGKVQRILGTAGRGAGQLAYPYSVSVLEDGTIMVSEFGNNRVQRLDKDGKCLGLFGRLGRGPGELQYPWAIAHGGDRLFVLDSGNNRVQVVKMPQ